MIPVRAGSRRLPNKNIAPFAGTNLLINKIRQLKAVPMIDEIVVTSDSDEMLRMAEIEAAIPHRRELKYCDDKSVPFGEVVRHVCGQIDSENILWTPCTAPLMEAELISNAIQDFEKYCINKHEFDSLMAVESFKKYVWDKSGPVNYELGLKHVISQNLPTFYFITFGLFISPRIKMLDWAYLHGPNPYKFEVSKQAAVDIDDGLDLACARA